jgi:glucokinase
MNRYLGLDLGGTNIKAVVLGVEDDTIDTMLFETVLTHADRGPLGVIDRLIEVGRRMEGEHGPFEAVGLGVPGIFDSERGTVELFPNLPGPWKGRPIRDRLQEGLERRVTLINDARAFSLAEATIGAGRGCDTVVCVTLGTGIGGGIVIAGRLHLGAWGVAGEIGHQIVLVDGPECGCGNRGCVEALAKADVLAGLAGKADAEEVYRSALDGHTPSLAAIETVATWIGVGLANMVTTLGPDRIVVGGGIATAGELALDPIRQVVRSRVTLVPVDQIQVVAAELGAQAGAVGAALAAAEPPTPFASGSRRGFLRSGSPRPG